MTVYPHSVQTDTPTPPASLKSAMTKAIALAKDGATQDDLDTVTAILTAIQGQFQTHDHYSQAIAESQFVADQVSAKRSLEMLAGYLFYVSNDPDPKLWNDYFTTDNKIQHDLHLQLARAI